MALQNIYSALHSKLPHMIKITKLIINLTIEL